ncbi:MAG: hypothetical protein L0154_11920 [Chloroflexi bacterium]|nr:hypothetical protein [Chloroflexota bacterium]
MAGIEIDPEQPGYKHFRLYGLAVADLQTYRLRQIIPVGHMPYGVVVDNRRVYVSSFGSDSFLPGSVTPFPDAVFRIIRVILQLTTCWRWRTQQCCVPTGNRGVS